MKKLYNEKIKESFLNIYDNENSRKTIKNVFVKSAVTEKILGKDLYEFNLEEIKSTLYNMNVSTILSAKTNGRFIETYINWALKLGYRTNLNPLMGLLPEFYEQFAKGKKTLFSEKEILSVENKLVNSQDALIIRAAFVGISMEELLNLKEEDVYPVSGKLNLHNGQSSRTLIVDDSTMSLIKKALQSKIYYIQNDKALGKKKTAELADNEYVIKTMLGTGSVINFEKSDTSLIYRRLNPITKLPGYKNFTYGNIARSGRLKWVKDNYHRFGDLNKDLLFELAEHFSFKKVMVNKEPNYNIHQIKNYITKEALIQVYPEMELIIELKK